MSMLRFFSEGSGSLGMVTSYSVAGCDIPFLVTSVYTVNSTSNDYARRSYSIVTMSLSCTVSSISFDDLSCLVFEI